MLEGIVQSGEARVKITVREVRGRRRQLDAIIDTGYTSYLTLAPDVIEALALRWHSVGSGILADGRKCLFDVFEATVLWDGKARRILVDEADADPLLGMAMLDGHELNMQVQEGGKITIQRIES
jgi:clan AA aspartic protease